MTALLLINEAQATSAEIEQSVVKIVNQFNLFDWYSPWASGSTSRGTGSGFVISGKRIMTNAHVVRDSALLLVYLHNDPNPYPARVAAIGHDCDLAILELEEHSRLNEVPALPFDELPALRSQVVTYGYPAGGKLLSSTAGVVSRIEISRYSHSYVDHHLTIQTDAAINPGNSGGPVIQNEKVVGVAFQGSQQLENTGYVIPVPIIRHFLTDLEDGTYDGFPELGLLSASLENPAARKYAAMKPGESGNRVDTILRGGSAENVLFPGDVITAIDGYPIANDGTIDWQGMRLDFWHVADLKQMGQHIPLELIRKGKRMLIDVPLIPYPYSPTNAKIYDRRPEYYVYAGLVFTPLNHATASTHSGKWSVKAPQELIHEMYYRFLFENDFYSTPQVMILRKLNHEVNVEESTFLYRLIDTVNGQKVRTLADAVQAIEQNTNIHHVIEYQHFGRITVLDRAAADEANAEILENYAIAKDRNL